MKTKAEENGFIPLLDAGVDGACSCHVVRRCTSSPSRIFRLCCIVLTGFLIIEILVFNFVLIYGLVLYKDNFSFLLKESDASLFDRLGESPLIKSLILKGKLVGFSSLLQNTVERVFIDFDIPHQNERSSGSIRGVASLGIDVSDAGEALYLYRRFLNRKKFPYSKLVVDIGANDGLLASNSLNFIKWGWNAILVEPDRAQLEMAKYNVHRYVESQKDRNVTVRFVEGLIGNRDGLVDFISGGDVTSQEGHLADAKSRWGSRASHIMKVDSYTVQTFTNKYNIPKMFGILSIDAEGVGNKILHDFMDLGFRPAYIIYEHLHEHNEDFSETNTFMADHGYQFLTRRGWNFLFEHLIEE